MGGEFALFSDSQLWIITKILIYLHLKFEICYSTKTPYFRNLNKTTRRKILMRRKLPGCDRQFFLFKKKWLTLADFRFCLFGTEMTVQWDQRFVVLIAQSLSPLSTVGWKIATLVCSLNEKLWTKSWRVSEPSGIEPLDKLLPLQYCFTRTPSQARESGKGRRSETLNWRFLYFGIIRFRFRTHFNNNIILLKFQADTRSLF